jgi:hypothetical protein
MSQPARKAWVRGAPLTETEAALRLFKGTARDKHLVKHRLLVNGAMLSELRLNDFTGEVEETGDLVYVHGVTVRSMEDLFAADAYYRRALIAAAAGQGGYDTRRVPRCMPTFAKYLPSTEQTLVWRLRITNVRHPVTQVKAVEQVRIQVPVTLRKWNLLWPAKHGAEEEHDALACDWCTCPGEPRATAPQIVKLRHGVFLAYHAHQWMLANFDRVNTLPAESTDENRRWYQDQRDVSATKGSELWVVEAPASLESAARNALRAAV